jgi:hypothetical protein
MRRCTLALTTAVMLLFPGAVTAEVDGDSVTEGKVSTIST